MRLSQSLKQRPTVSPQLVLANDLLQFSTLELEQAIIQELAQNPALELREIRRCPVCGAEMTGGLCEVCRREELGIVEPWRDAHGLDADDDYLAGAARDATPSEDWDDPVSGLPSRTTLTEHVLAQARVGLPAEDLGIARRLVGSLDGRGLLSSDLDSLAAELHVAPARVERILTFIQSLEPAGVGARDARECLLIQLRQFTEASHTRSVAEHLVAEHWDSLARSALTSLGKGVGTSVDEVRKALRFIRENLNPFPAHTYWARERSGPPPETTLCPEPDVIIREEAGSPTGYQIELPKASRYRLRVMSSYRNRGGGGPDQAGAAEVAEWRHWEELCGRARLFARSVEQRWRTLHDLMRCLVDLQTDYLVRGEQGLKPLTRARVAEIMAVHESTVSRAVSDKYVQLPNGRIVPLETFFDSAAPIKCLIRELVDEEKTPLSDQEIAERLAEHGHDVARRTVAKYRNALNILPSSLRQRERELRRRH